MYICILAFINIFFSTDNIYAKTLTVNDIKISTPFEINFDKNEIIDEGFTQAFDHLILSIVQTKNQNKLKKNNPLKNNFKIKINNKNFK